MKVKRYTGASLEKIREAVVRELGENAVLVNIKKNEKSSMLPIGGGKGGPMYEVVAAAEEGVDVDGLPAEQPSGGFAAFLDEQKNQYRGIRQSIKLIDAKIADVDDRLESFGKDAKSKEFEEELANVHPEWRSLVLETAVGLAETGKPQPADFHEALASMVPTAGGILFRQTPSSPPDIYALVGQTGVGKTTTLAKLAAKCVLREKLNVGLITLDTFRVAAVDQLREYSSLLGVEVAVAFTGKEVRRHIEKFHDKDVVFIDTPGRGQFDESGIAAVAESLNEVDSACVILVAPANLRREDAAPMMANYGKLKPSALIISKTDEASRCDGITKLLEFGNLPVLYLTDGQQVPDDIHVASPGIVASMVMPFVDNPEPIKIGGGRRADPPARNAKSAAGKTPKQD